jgi:phosphotransferase system  glucose/maltose/N-acetylglucosamine-specific IIC component
MFQQIGDSWQGPLGGWAKLVFGFTFVLGMLLLFVLYQVAHSTDHPVVHALWAIAGLTVIVIMGFTKEWMFARMNMLTILREIKRLQVQVALLSEEKSRD